MVKRPVIIQNSLPLSSLGGPTKALERLLASPLAERFEFHTVFQEAAGGINWRLISRMAKEMRAYKPDLVHVRGLQNEGFHGVMAARMAGCRRVVVSVHGFAGDAMGSGVARSFVFNRVLEPLTLRLSSAAYCVCQAAERRPIFSKNARMVIPAIHNGIEPSPPRDRGSRQEFGFSDSDVVAILVSRIVVDKGFSYIVDAVASGFMEAVPSLRLLIVGEGPYEAELRARLAAYISNGRVVLAGRRSDVPALLAGSDMFVFPTLHENLSNALLEAMDARLPVVATAVGGNPEVVVNGETGFLVPAADSTALADRIHRLASDSELRLKMGAASRRRIEAHFSLAQTIEKIGQAYDHVLEI